MKNDTYKLLKDIWLLIPVLAFVAINAFYAEFLNYKWYEFPYVEILNYIFEVLESYENETLTELFDLFSWDYYVSSFFMLASVAVVMFYNPFQELYENTRVHGSARFAKFKDIKKAGFFAKNGIVLGNWRNKTLRLNEPLSVLVLAPPGTGKSAGVAIPTLFQCKNSIVCLDVKGELFATTSKHRATFSKVMVFEPTNPKSSKWNPFAKSSLPEDQADLYIKVQKIGSILFDSSQSQDKYWQEAAKKIFINTALSLIAKHGETSLPLIYQATLGEDRKIVLSELAQIQELDQFSFGEMVKKELSEYINKADNQFSGEVGSFDVGMQAFTDPRLANALSQDEIRFQDLRGIEGKAVSLYLIIKPEDVDRLAPVIRLFFEFMTQYFLSNPVDKKKDRMVTLVLDEFIRLGKLDQIIQMPALSRGQWVNAIFIAQSIGQIDRLYQDSGRREIMATTAVKIIFSQNDNQSAKEVSDSIGQTTVEITNRSEGSGTLSKSSQSEQGQALLSPQKIQTIPKTDCYVLYQFGGERPIQAKIAYWFQETWKRKAGVIDNSLIYKPHQNNSNQEEKSQVSSPPQEDLLLRIRNLPEDQKILLQMEQDMEQNVSNYLNKDMEDLD